MDVTIIGASGDVGTETVTQLLAGRVLTPSERLQVVGRVEGKSSSKLYGLQSDLSDAYAEVTPELDVVLTPKGSATGWARQLTMRLTRPPLPPERCATWATRGRGIACASLTSACCRCSGPGGAGRRNRRTDRQRAIHSTWLLAAA